MVNALESPNAAVHVDVMSEYHRRVVVWRRDHHVGLAVEQHETLIVAPNVLRRNSRLDHGGVSRAVALQQQLGLQPEPKILRLGGNASRHS